MHDANNISVFYRELIDLLSSGDYFALNSLNWHTDHTRHEKDEIRRWKCGVYSTKATLLMIWSNHSRSEVFLPRIEFLEQNSYYNGRVWSYGIIDLCK